ncbi:MAG: Uma2 family endonuclease, partial [Gemmatimonadota bacterium]
RNLLLVIEVLSPSTKRADRFTKRRRYQVAGVPLYWIVDGASEAIEAGTPEAPFPTIERGQVIWSPPEASEALVIELRELFAPIP